MTDPPLRHLLGMVTLRRTARDGGVQFVCMITSRMYMYNAYTHAQHAQHSASRTVSQTIQDSSSLLFHNPPIFSTCCSRNTFFFIFYVAVHQITEWTTTPPHLLQKSYSANTRSRLIILSFPHALQSCFRGKVRDGPINHHHRYLVCYCHERKPEHECVCACLCVTFIYNSTLSHLHEALTWAVIFLGTHLVIEALGTRCWSEQEGDVLNCISLVHIPSFYHISFVFALVANRRSQ